MSIPSQTARWLAVLALSGIATTASAVDPAAVERARKQVLMLDALYKNAVVLITDTYVHTPGDISAATASKALFGKMKEAGFHEARLLGFTDVLFNPAENTPHEGFEQKAKEALLAGSEFYSEVIDEHGKPHLYMATALPVVMEKCVMCHANFKDQKGPIGALSYKVVID